jgi:glycosyltransferase involved in cell wall biosynthesis
MRISACWIVRNEAANIAASIASVKDCADEMIVVDTGSTDDTARIAQEYGARVEKFEWVGDFSAAKNFALSFATGDYVILIDADEFFDPALTQADQEKIIRIFKQTKADVMQIPRAEVESATGHVREIVPYSRILRRTAIHYEYRIHEMLKLKDGKSPRAYIWNELRLVHTGYSAARITEKLLRNIDLLEAEQADPTDELRLISNKAYLMREYMSLHVYGKAYENCRYLLDHTEAWARLCRILSPNHVQCFYIAIRLAAMMRYRLSCEEVHEKLILGIQKNYPDLREAQFAELYYQLLFDFQEDRFLTELTAAEILAATLPPAASMESRQAEAAIFGRGAMAADQNGETEKACRWAEIALRIEPLLNTERLKKVLHSCAR